MVRSWSGWHNTPVSRRLRVHEPRLCSQLIPRRRGKDVTSFSEKGFDSKGGEVSYLFNPWKVVSHSLFQQKSASFFFKAWKKGLHLSMNRLMNQLRAARCSFSIWTSFTQVNEFIFRIADIFGVDLDAPLSDQISQKLSEVTPNVHFSGLSFTLYCLKRSKALSRCWRWSVRCTLFTNISSTYTFMMLPIIPLKTWLTIRWNKP